MRIRRHAAAWLAAVAVLAASIGGCAALVQIVKSSYCRAELQGEADRVALKVGDILAAQPQTHPIEYSQTLGSVTFGLWNANRRQFLSRHPASNAVEVMVEGTIVPTSNNWPRRLLAQQLQGKTRAVAAIRPRDIVFVVDLSGAMTNATRESLDTLLRVGIEDAAYSEDRKLRLLYSDLGFNSYPGELEPFGTPWQVEEGPEAFDALISEQGPLADHGIDQRYRIHRDDSLAERRRKVFSAVIEQQLVRLMPQVKPDPLVSDNFEYWAEYLDEVLSSGDRHARIGYASYLRFLLEHGRNIRAGGQYVALSLYSQNPSRHTEEVDSKAFRLPPRTQPMHEVRRGMLAALVDIASCNRPSIPPDQRDRVAIITFDSLSPQGTWVEQPLTSDYQAASRKSARLQAVGQRTQTAKSLAALQRASELLQQQKRQDQDATQHVVLVTANLAQDVEVLLAKIGEMARLGQTVSTISVGTLPEEANSSANQQFADWLTRQPGYGLEAKLRDAVPPVSVVLVQ